MTQALKPTLHEVAAMPFPDSMLAMRRHYNPEWGKPIPDGAELATYEVKIEYSVRSTERQTYTVEAYSEEEAEAAAEKLFDKDGSVPHYQDIEVDNVVAKERAS